MQEIGCKKERDCREQSYKLSCHVKGGIENAESILSHLRVFTKHAAKTPRATRNWGALANSSQARWSQAKTRPAVFTQPCNTRYLLGNRKRARTIMYPVQQSLFFLSVHILVPARECSGVCALMLLLFPFFMPADLTQLAVVQEELLADKKLTPKKNTRQASAYL